MKIYVDFDDCLCETARNFTELAKELFGITVPYEDVKHFDLKESFGLDDKEYEELMRKGHTQEVLLSYEETPGASLALNELMDLGHTVCVVTGRPDKTYPQSRRWLDEHGLKRAELYFLNKYGRDLFYQNGSYNLDLNDFYRMDFACAIEDSPLAFPYLDHFPGIRVMVFDRPWNRECELRTNYKRIENWEEIKKNLI